MNLIQRFKCLRGMHQRSRGHAREDGATFRSKCTGCGRPMIRTIEGWHVVEPAGEK